MEKEKASRYFQQTADYSLALVAVSWKDNKVVYFTTNCDKQAPTESGTIRYCSDVKNKLFIFQPAYISKYNKALGGVDRADQNVSS